MREVACAVRSGLHDDLEAGGVELEHLELTRAGEEALQDAVELLGAAQVQERLAVRARAPALPLRPLALGRSQDVEQERAQSRLSSLAITLRQARPALVRLELVALTLRTIVRE